MNISSKLALYQPGKPLERGTDIATSRTYWHTVLYHTLQCYSIPYHTIPYHTVPYHTIPYHIPYTIYHIPYTILYHTIPYHTIYRTIPYHTMLFQPDLFGGHGTAAICASLGRARRRNSGSTSQATRFMRIQRPQS